MSENTDTTDSPVLMFARGYNRMKFPVTAFSDMKTALDVIESLDLAVEISDPDDSGDVAVSAEDIRSVDARRELADAFWDGYYFMGDPPSTYVLSPTHNDVGVFYISDD